MRMNWTTASVSATGGRDNNQDYCDYRQQRDKGCWIVADGLGGHHGGDIASRVAGEAMLRAWSEVGTFSRTELSSAFALAQAALHQQQTALDLNDMRTTAVALYRQQQQVLWGHVGDSRLYHFRGGHIESHTKDHSVPQMLVVTEEIEFDDIRTHPDRNLLLRTIGEHGTVQPTVLKTPVTVQPNDAFLMCTDGFWEYLLEMDMEADLQASDHVEDWLQRMVHRLRSRATGAFDNYTAIVVRVD